MAAYTTIDDPSAYFQTAIYTGDGANSHAITNTGNSDLQPDWLWIKRRDGAVNHLLHDSVRGVTNLLVSNTNAGDDSNSNIVLGFDSDGFRVGANSASNGNNQTFVAWQWKETATAGFDIVSYTGDGAEGRNISHSLSAVPAMMIVKNRDASVKWAVYHKNNTAAPETDHLKLNVTDATADDDSTWDDTAPTSSTFRVKGSSSVNGDGVKYIAYLFAQKQGYSKFGGYLGTGNADGPFIYTGMKPAWVMVKTTTTTQSWQIYDNKRDSFNQMTNTLFANENNAEATNNGKLDFLSNGFKLRDGDYATNKSGESYIFMAFAENPFVTSTGVPTTAR